MVVGSKIEKQEEKVKNIFFLITLGGPIDHCLFPRNPRVQSFHLTLNTLRFSPKFDMAGTDLLVSF